MSDLQIKQAKALIIILAGITVYQFFTIKGLARALYIGQQQFDKLHNAADYLLDIINEHDIELTEFDLIALTAITEDK